MDADDSLTNYQAKRHFQHTSEPVGGQHKSSKNPVFIVQQHHSSTHHYDFRLEIDGTLKSWAVPKGPSVNPSTKRLAVPTEDHPLEYASFEGIIPHGEYGAGTVLLWDSGTYRNLKEINGAPLPMGDILTVKPLSVASGKTMEQIEKGIA
jgi:DNA ligase D-like protein (predicted 3'-phosphoesterase)